MRGLMGPSSVRPRQSSRVTPLPRQAGRGGPEIAEGDHYRDGIGASGFFPRTAKVDVHTFQGHIDHVRRFLGQSGVRGGDLDDLLLGWMADNVNLRLGGRRVNNFLVFRVHSHLFLRRGGDFLLRDLLLVWTGARRG